MTTTTNETAATDNTFDGDVIDVQAVVVDENDSDFESGFSGEQTTTTPNATNDDKPEAADDSTPEPAAATTEAAPAAEAPKLAQITEAQFNELLAKAESIDQVRADSKRQIDTLAGHLGGMKQVVDGLKQQRATLTPGQLKRVKAEFPDLGELLEADLGESFGGAGGQTLDPGEIDKRVQAGIAAALPQEVVKLEMKLLRSYHRDWEAVVVSNEFQAWEKTLPPEDQQKLNTSTDGEYIADKITEFKEKRKADADAAAKAKADADAAAALATKSANRQKQLEAAVPPRGAGGHGAAAPEEDEFTAGFNSRAN